MLREGWTDVMAVAHVDDDQNPAARITLGRFQHTLGQMCGVGMPGVSNILTGQSRDGVVKFICDMMPPTLIDSSGIG